MTLRDGLNFHDGSPVLARDSVASIQRWWQRDGFGGVLRRQPMNYPRRPTSRSAFG